MIALGFRIYGNIPKGESKHCKRLPSRDKEKGISKHCKRFPSRDERKGSADNTLPIANTLLSSNMLEF
jgi:hypothetical protein